MLRSRGLSAGAVANASFHSFQPNSKAKYKTPAAVGAATAGRRFIECCLRVAVMIKLLSRRK
jgi:hypothetical protein